MKSTSTINPAITDSTEWSIVEACASFINLKVGVSLNHGVALCFISLLAFQTCWATFQAKNNVSSTPASSALTRTETITRAPQIVTYTAMDKGM